MTYPRNEREANAMLADQIEDDEDFDPPVEQLDRNAVLAVLFIGIGLWSPVVLGFVKACSS